MTRITKSEVEDASLDWLESLGWTMRENVRAQLRVLVKRILHKHGYPPDKQEKATRTILEQPGVCSFSMQ